MKINWAAGELTQTLDRFQREHGLTGPEFFRLLGRYMVPLALPADEDPQDPDEGDVDLHAVGCPGCAAVQLVEVPGLPHAGPDELLPDAVLGCDRCGMTWLTLAG